MDIVSPEKAKKTVEDDAKHVTQDDLQKVVERTDELEKMVRDEGPLARYIRDVKPMLSMLRDYMSGNYRAMPWWSIAAVVATMLYLLNPLDLIPDAIPGLGLLDDIAILTACLRLVEKDLNNYEKWKLSSTE